MNADQIKINRRTFNSQQNAGKNRMYFIWQKKNKFLFYFFRFGANNKLNTHIKQQIVKEYMRWREAKKREKQERENWIEINSNKSNDIKKNMCDGYNR